MKAIKRYGWLLEWISAAILLAVGILVVVEKQIILYITGVVFILMGLLRIIPLIKTTEDKLSKYLFAAEVFIEVICGAFLIFMGTEGKTVGKVYGYIVGAVFYLRGFTHFLATSLKNEPSTKVSFFANMVLLTLGVYLFAYGKINSKVMGWIIFAILILCVIFLCIKGVKDYTNYRGNLVTEHQTKKLKKIEMQIENTNPTSEEIDTNNLNIDKESHVEEINA